MSGNSIPAKPKQRMEKPKQATLKMLLFSHGKEPPALPLLYQRGDAGERTLLKTPLSTDGNEMTEMSCQWPANEQTAHHCVDSGESGRTHQGGTAMKAFLFLLAGSAGLLLAGWGSTWLTYALTRGVLSLVHLTSTVAGLTVASYGLRRWELCD